MKTESGIVSISLIALISVLTIGTATTYGSSPSPSPSQPSRQTQVHKVGQKIMNFDLTNSIHIFTNTTSGGKLTVLAKASNLSLVHDIRSHLSIIIKGFKVGNYTDPTLIHGASMPGLATLRRDFENILVTYQEEKAGGAITFFSKIDRDIKAIHLWFAAQMYDHGADATTNNSMESMITTKAMWERHHPGVLPPSYLKK